jgi:hypothetical protein
MVSLSPLVRNFPKPRDVSGFSDLDLCLYRLRERIYRTAVFCNGFSSRSILTITVPCRSSGFYPPRCYQASSALSPQYFLRICHPLHPAPLRDLLRGSVLWRHSSLQRQCRRASPGKTHRLPVSRPNFTAVRFTGYQGSPSHVGSTSLPLPYSRFAVRYVHRFCLMLPSDIPFLDNALALLALPFRPVTAGVLYLPACRQKCSQCAMPGTRKLLPAGSR